MKEPFFHFSVDDVCLALVEQSRRGGELLAHPFFAFLAELHDRYGVLADLYCFWQCAAEGQPADLTAAASDLAGSLAGQPWLRFGPHGLDREVPPYAQEPQAQKDVFDQILAELTRIAGRASRSRWVRLHCFSESYELASYFRDVGIELVLTTDKDAVSHRMPEEVKAELAETGFSSYQGLRFARSHFRGENFANDHLTASQIAESLDRQLDRHGFVTIFTHEYEIERPEVRRAVRDALAHLHKNRISSI